MTSIDLARITTTRPDTLRRPEPGGRGDRSQGTESGFDRLLDSICRAPPPETEPASGSEGVVFSRHATARLDSRGIELSAEDLEDMASAIDRLDEKNAKESLLLMGDKAFIVGVPKRTVITAMTRSEAVGSVFTNIDSTMVVR